MKALSIIAKEPEVTQVQIQSLAITPPDVINYNLEVDAMPVEGLTAQWLTGNVPLSFEFKNNELYDSMLLKMIEDWDNTVSYVDLLSKKLVYRMHGFLKLRLPMSRNDIHLGRHWV